MGCLNDFDCPGTLLCYNTTWTNHVGICNCSNWYGFSGPNCLEFGLTSTSKFRIFGGVLNLTFWSLLILFSIREFRKFSLIFPAWSISHTCQLQIVFASIFQLLTEALDFSILTHPADYNSKISKFPIVKGSLLFNVAAIFNAFGDCFIYLALAALPAHWRGITHQAFRNDNTTRSRLSFTNTLIIFEVLFFLAISITTITAGPGQAFIVSMPFVIFLMFAYLFYGVALIRVLMDIAKTQDEKKIKFLKSSRKIAHLCLIIFALGASDLILDLLVFIYDVEPRWREYSPIGQFAFPVLFTQFNSWIVMCCAIVCQSFLTISIKSYFRKKQTSTQKNQEPGEEYENGIVPQETGTVTHGESANPDSIVHMNDIRSVKMKQKKAKNVHRLKPIEDVTVSESSFQNQYQESEPSY